MSTTMDDIDLLSETFLNDPYVDYARVQADRPLYCHPSTGYWWLTRYEDVHQALRDPNFRSGRIDALFEGVAPDKLAELQPLRQLLRPRILFAEGAEHHRLRGLLSQAFTPRQLEAMRPVVRQTINELLQPLRDKHEFEFVREFADPLPSRVICRILGLPRECFVQFKNWTNDIYEFIGVSGRDKTERALQATAAASELQRFLERELHQRQPRPEPDLLSLLARVEEAGQQLSRVEIIANVIGLLNAGHETTTNLLSNGLYLLAQHPQQQQRLRENPELISFAVEEIARCESPVQLIARQLAESTTLHGVTLPAGANMLLILGAANRDPQAFSWPMEFDIGRTTPRHLAFGHGPHFCIGAALARMISQEALAAILATWPSWQLTGEVEWRPYPVFRGPRELRVITGARHIGCEGE